MGLKMSDADPNLSTIHVPSGPTTLSSSSATDLSSLSLPELITRRDNLEAELKALGAVLDSHGVTMQTTLTTFDGYPRADIDVAQVRVTRARIIRLRNDWKDVMAAVERGLHAWHAANKNVPTQAQTQTPTPTPQESIVTQQASADPPAAPEAPFARVNTVEPGSPANEAGLKVGDLIRRFGGAIWSNHERLRMVGEVVQQSQGRPILVRVQRKLEGQDVRELELRVTPRVGWGGRGSLGCHILPL